MNKKVAIVCDWLTNYGGAERVIEVLSDMFPEAPIYTSIFNPEAMPTFANRKVVTSFIQNFPFAKKNHRHFLKLMPYAFEQFDLSDYGLVISSSHCCAKGVITKPETLHISYCHNPMRYVWDDFHQYINQQRLHRGLKTWVHYMLSDIRSWDRLASDRVDFFLANSECVRKRILKYYRRDAEVIYPPCDISSFSSKSSEGAYFLGVGRIIPYKRFDLLVEAFNVNGLPLKIVGEGSELKHLKKLAKSNIEFSGTVSENDLRKIYAEAKALVFPQNEDFGIAPIEAMASGKPVICFSRGGALETVREGESGVFFHHQSVDALNQAITKFFNLKFDSEAIRNQALKFDIREFQKKLSEFIARKWKEWETMRT